MHTLTIEKPKLRRQIGIHHITDAVKQMKINQTNHEQIAIINPSNSAEKSICWNLIRLTSCFICIQSQWQNQNCYDLSITCISSN